MLSGNKNRIWLILAVLVLLYIGARSSCYFIDAKLDEGRRPWAYSKNEQDRLVGRWQGQCTDPDGQVHLLDMEIFVPETDEKRWKRATRKRKSKARRDLLFFNGLAMVTAHGQRDSCELWGGLEDAQGRNFHFQIAPLNGRRPAGFNFNLLKGSWNGDKMELEATFAWIKPDGSSFSDSADPRFETPGYLKMQRQ